jgi:hypothetical protein
MRIAVAFGTGGPKGSIQTCPARRESGRVIARAARRAFDRLRLSGFFRVRVI